jgi:predicted nuclease of predicted toxin-antitoxin system
MLLKLSLLNSHIPKAVATQLRNRGVDVLRCEDVDMAAADDVEHLEYATAQGRTLVSHDRDYWTHHGEWLAQGMRPTGIVLFSNQLQSHVGRLVTELYELFQMIEGNAGTLEQDVYNKVYEVNE